MERYWFSLGESQQVAVWLGGEFAKPPKKW